MEKDPKSGGRKGDSDSESKSWRSTSQSTIKRKGDFDAITQTFRSIKEFYMRIWRGDNLNSRYGRDLYSWMLACDLICFVLMMVPVLGNMPDQQFVPVNMQVSKDIFRVDFMFIMLLVVSIFSMTLDRVLHVKKSIKGKLILLLVQHIVIQSWIFIFMPMLTDSNLVSEKPLVQVWYAFRSVYFILSSWQVSNGYPPAAFKKHHRYNLWDYVWFIGYVNTPFLLEFRLMTNWISTDTTLNFSEFLRLETMYCTLFNQRCRRQLEKDFLKKPGEASTLWIKVVLATSVIILCSFLALIGFILFSLINLIGVHHKITLAELDVYVQGYPPVFQTSLNDVQDRPSAVVSKAERNQLLHALEQDPSKDIDRVRKLIRDFYLERDMQVLKFVELPNHAWQPPSESLDSLFTDLVNVNKTMNWCTLLTLTREGGESKGEEVRRLSKCKAMTNLRRKLLARAITVAISNITKITTDYNKRIQKVAAMPPKKMAENEHLIYTKDGQTGELQSIVFRIDVDLAIVARLPQSADPELFTPGKEMKFAMEIFNDEHELVWKFFAQKYVIDHEAEGQGQADAHEKQLDIKKFHGYILFCLIDQFFPSLIQAVAGSGTIYAIYFMLVFPIAMKLRSVFLGAPGDIMWEEPQYLDRLLKICEDIEQVQKQAGLYGVEEKLYAKLLAAFVNPQVFVHATKFPRIKDRDAIKALQ